MRGPEASLGELEVQGGMAAAEMEAESAETTAASPPLLLPELEARMEAEFEASMTAPVRPVSWGSEEPAPIRPAAILRAPSTGLSKEKGSKECKATQAPGQLWTIMAVAETQGLPIQA